ncbi:PilN domain-containing protein [Bergeriella denitrificans]|uniref:PilN n=1 Tax=Bergeriella denitrificans TaxID=494 RepID=A0A378UFJ9_BERDE|nr:PilN domain-containing protein [Bergeriella denitrificans]STZ75523.1 PilN [Bergeriella denitrificans]
MIEPVKINLLPYRETERLHKQQQFKVLMLSALIGGLALAVGAYVALGAAIGNQESRNRHLENEIGKLDQNLGEIQKLQQEKERFLAKKQKVEELQQARHRAARMLDTLNARIPADTYLTSLEAESPDTYKLSGRALNDNKIAVFMQALPAGGVFGQPELLGIQKNGSYQSFTLKARLSDASAEPEAPQTPQPTQTQEPQP